MELDGRLISKVASYKPTSESIDPIRETPILFVVGIAGAGKDTVQTKLMNAHRDEYHYIISHTTRKPRENHGVMEQDGVAYHFIDFATAEQMIDDRAFVEAKVVHFNNIYGTSIAEIKKAKASRKIAITDIEVKGVKEYVGLGMNVKPVFLLPPSFEVWWERLAKRYDGDIPQKDIYNRMKTALVEIEHALNTDYFYIIINDDLEKTVELVNQIAHGEQVEPHYYKAMDIARHMVLELRKKIADFE
jgi:guanylate kinase